MCFIPAWLNVTLSLTYSVLFLVINIHIFLAYFPNSRLSRLLRPVPTTLDNPGSIVLWSHTTGRSTYFTAKEACTACRPYPTRVMQTTNAPRNIRELHWHLLWKSNATEAVLKKHCLGFWNFIHLLTAVCCFNVHLCHVIHIIPAKTNLPITMRQSLQDCGKRKY